MTAPKREMTATKVDTLLANWPSTMDTPGDADKMQQMVSLARELQVALTLAQGNVQGWLDANGPGGWIDELRNREEAQTIRLTAAEKERDGLFADTTALTDMLGDETARRVAAEKRIGELEGRQVGGFIADAVGAALTRAMRGKLFATEAGDVERMVRQLEARAEDSKSRLSALQLVVEQKDKALRYALQTSHPIARCICVHCIAVLDALQLSPDAAQGIQEMGHDYFGGGGADPAPGEQADTTRDAVIVRRTHTRIHRPEECDCPDQSPAKHGEA